jgi:hypothetical protein
MLRRVGNLDWYIPVAKYIYVSGVEILNIPSGSTAFDNLNLPTGDD